MQVRSMQMSAEKTQARPAVFAGPTGIILFTLVAIGINTTFARGQDAGDLAGPADAFAAADMGFATGEPSRGTVPYEANPPETPAMDWFGRWQEMKSSLEKKTGTSFGLYINPSDQVIVSGPGSGLNRGVFFYNFHLAQTLWPGARLVSNTRGGDGLGVNRYGDSLFNVNQHAGERSAVYVSHLFLEQKLFKDRVTLAAGKLDLLDTFDTNEVADWNIMPYSLARNPTIPAAFHAIGASARWDVTQWLYVQAGVADAGGKVATTGVNTAFDDNEPYFSMYEAGLKPKLLGRPGNYRFFAWHNSGTVARIDGTGSRHGDTGVGISFDQQLTEHLSVFTRYGFAEPDVHSITNYWSAGAAYTGPLPGRPRDVLGLAVGQGILSGDYRQAANRPSTATQFDLFYNIQVQPWLTLTPDIQVIVNPDGAPARDVLVVAGLNAEFRF